MIQYQHSWFFLSWQYISQINAATFWTSGCTVPDPQLLLRAKKTANRKWSIHLRLTLKESPERCHYPVYGSPLKAHQSMANRTQISKYPIRTGIRPQSAVRIMLYVCILMSGITSGSREPEQRFREILQTTAVNSGKRALAAKHPHRQKVVR